MGLSAPVTVFVTVLVNLTKFLVTAMSFAKARSDRKSGRAEQLAEILLEAQQDIETAMAVRQAVDDELRAHPDRLFDDDGYRRD